MAGIKISAIVPTLNEASLLHSLLPGLMQEGVEVLVVDGGSADATLPVARGFPVKVLQTRTGRAVQMNAGARAAAGDWLWFLHADTILPPDWQGQLRRAMENPAVVGGGFRSVIDAPGAGYRFLDAWGWMRTRVQRSFYGDQGIFVRRNLFERLGRFAEIPVCEDAEFSGRMWRAGQVAMLPGPIRTSARRWQRNGWWRMVAEHTILAIRHELARDQRRLPAYAPAAVAPSVHLVVVAKAPIPGRVKTRLTPPLSAVAAAQVARALLEDTLRRVGRIPHTRLVVAVEPPEAVPLMRRIAPGAEVVPQTAGDLGARMSAIVADRFARGASAVLLIGSDHPTLWLAEMDQAIRWLREGGDQLVIGPAEDGGYYLIGLTRPHPELFSRISWSGPTVLQDTLARARDADLQIRQLSVDRDVDTIEDLVRLQRRLSGDHDVAPATACWLQRHRIPEFAR